MGAQEPVLCIHEATAESYGPDALRLAQAYAFTPFAWQTFVTKIILALTPERRWAHTAVGLSVPRQNGKNVVLEIIELYQMLVLNRMILHTSHEIKTSKKAFIRFCEIFQDRRFPELARRVKVIRSTNGQEAVLLHTATCRRLDSKVCGCPGGGVLFTARSKSAARGYTVDTLVLDEAQELGEVVYAALLPTISAAPSGNPQQLLAGTPPSPVNDGEVFTRVRRAAMSSVPGVAWLEWSFDADGDPSDTGQWAQANPSLGWLLSLDTVETEHAMLDEQTFCRERGGQWISATRGAVIPSHLWAGLAEPDSQPGPEYSIGVDQTPEGDLTSIAIASARPDGVWHTELVEHREGAGWVPDRVAQIIVRNPGACAVVIDAQSPAFGLVETLRSLGVIVTTTHAGQMGQACSAFLRLVQTGQLRHLGQPQMASAVSASRKRRIGSEGLWGWGRALSVSDISPVVATTLALWGAMSTTAQAQRRRRSGRSSGSVAGDAVGRQTLTRVPQADVLELVRPSRSGRAYFGG